MKAYSQDLRDRVLDKYHEGGITKVALAKLYKICDETIRNWIKLYNANGNCNSRQHLNKGPTYKFTNKQAILDFIAANPDADGIAIRDGVCPELAMSTFYDTLKRMEITFKKKSPGINKDRNLSGRTLKGNWKV